jgi:DNA-binding Xre family transcriptional regulator
MKNWQNEIDKTHKGQTGFFKQTMKQTIKNRMKELDWNLMQLHEVSGVRYATLSTFLNGDKQIRFHNLEKICNALDLELVCC